MQTSPNRPEASVRYEGQSISSLNKVSIKNKHYTPVHVIKSVKVKTCAWEWKRRYAAIAHNLIPGAGIITKCTRNNKFSMHNVRVTATCKILSHAQSTVFYWLDEVNRSITTLVLFESLFFHMHILATLGVCYFPPEQGSLKSKPAFYHSSNDIFELSISET